VIKKLENKMIREVIALNKKIKVQDEVIKNLSKWLKVSEQIKPTKTLPELVPLPAIPTNTIYTNYYSTQIDHCLKYLTYSHPPNRTNEPKSYFGT
jgi:hypothetical protein